MAKLTALMTKARTSVGPIPRTTHAGPTSLLRHRIVSRIVGAEEPAAVPLRPPPMRVANPGRATADWGTPAPTAAASGADCGIRPSPPRNAPCAPLACCRALMTSSG
eukprot:scaffold23961_cov131-Isochrysis_galbana.AAC.8